MNAKKTLGIISLGLITACTAPQRPTETPRPTLGTNKTTPAQIQTPSLGQQKTSASAISSWRIQGGMAAKSKSKGWSARMNWVQQGPASYQIRLMGPLGSGTVMIDKQGKTIRFQDGAKTSTSSNAEELLLKSTGIRLPVSNLYYWVRGLPAPGAVQAQQQDSAHHLMLLRQNGYTIHFMQYTSVKGIDLPSMIRLEGNGIMVKVMIRSWSI